MKYARSKFLKINGIFEEIENYKGCLSPRNVVFEKVTNTNILHYNEPKVGWNLF